ncbi:hypothetical protein [Streptomyces sp. NPDC046909]|uniref:hypothetical protein n=1 Tax=Streptomyces sp. NPDC046909 TaxID=3155617 RepID=UPI00340F7E91
MYRSPVCFTSTTSPGWTVALPHLVSTLAAVVDEKHADRLRQALAGRSVGDCLSSKAEPPPIADPDDTALEVAALMARVRSPLVAVAEKVKGGPEDGRTRPIGVMITASHLLHELLGAAGAISTTGS